MDYKKFVFAVVLALGCMPRTAVAQSYVLKGTVVDRDSSFAVPNSYVVNNKTYFGTVSNGIGYFEIPVSMGDTLVISNVGYQFYYLAIDSALVSGIREELLIKLVPRNYLLDEVSIYAITSNNPRTMPVNSSMIWRLLPSSSIWR